MQTNVPAIQFTDQGPVAPAESSILAGVQADINAAFGGGVNPQLTSSQGQLAQSLTAIVGDKNSDILEVANQVDPDVASGRWQDAIGRVYFLNRIAATIPASGQIDVPFQCQTLGPVACPIGALSRIHTAAQGWDRVMNATAGTPGQLVESRAAFEVRRRLSVAVNSVNGVQSVYGAVLNVPNARSRRSCSLTAEQWTTAAPTSISSRVRWALRTRGVAPGVWIRRHARRCWTAGQNAGSAVRSPAPRRSVRAST